MIFFFVKFGPILVIQLNKSRLSLSLIARVIQLDNGVPPMFQNQSLKVLVLRVHTQHQPKLWDASTSKRPKSTTYVHFRLTCDIILNM